MNHYADVDDDNIICNRACHGHRMSPVTDPETFVATFLPEEDAMQFLRRPLESTGWLMAALSLLFGVLMLVDPRAIEGAPAWLKPLKFAVSTAIYSVTLAWILRFLPAWLGHDYKPTRPFTPCVFRVMWF